MFDEYKVELPWGFLDHPHRGMEAITYLKEGTLRYEDSKNGWGKLKAGDV